MHLDSDKLHTKLLGQLASSKTLAFLGAMPGVNSNVYFVFGQAIIDVVVIVINDINRLIHHREAKRYDVISNVLNELSQKLKDLLEVSFKFCQSLDKTLTNPENYTVLIENLVSFFDSEDMSPDTKAPQKDFQHIKEQVLIGN
ncbi:hypothetical protein BDF21DRAFT_458804 [Thamnidium elegans]|nr:hypothetical protein BDF21DRAFT_458804 [Thamnidium elegans]